MVPRIVRYPIYIALFLFYYLFFSATKLGIEPTQLPPFELKQELKDIPNLNLDRLKNARFIELPGKFIEDVAVTNNGDILAIIGHGPSNIYRVNHANYSLYEKLGETSSRVLGTALNKQETLLAFIDEQEGLKVINLKTKEIKILASHFNDKKFSSLNSVTFVGSDYLYFTHSCDFSMTEYHYQLLYKTGGGQVFELNLKTQQLRLVLGGLQFANGITYSESQDSLYVVEINHYRVIKLDLAAIREKNVPAKTIVIDGLIGYPDNAKIAEDGNIWVAFPSLRDQGNVFIDNNPRVRRALINARISENVFLFFANLSYSGGIKINPKTGQIVDYFFGKSNKIDFVTGIVQKNKKVYLASLKHNVIAVVDYL